MLDSLYKSMTGLIGFTSALDNLSNNVANLNTPGYKGNDVLFRDLGAENQFGSSSQGNGFSNGIGQGVRINGTLTRFTQGDVQQTGGETDLAISGEAFFVLDGGTTTFYTRAGQFRFDEEGYLVDPGTGYRVHALDESGNLTYINLNDFQQSEAEQTTEVILGGVMDNSTSTGDVFPSDDDEKIEITLFDSGGKENTVFIEFEKRAGRVWDVRLVDDNGALVAPEHRMEFTSLGSIVTSTSEFVFDYQSFELLEQEGLYNAYTPGDEMLFPDGLVPEVTTNFQFEDSYVITRSSDEFQFDNSGSYYFNDQGYLISADSELRVASRNDAGEIQDYYIGELLQTPSEATTEIQVTANLNTNIAVGETYPDYAEQGIPVEYIDGDNGLQSIYVRFTREGENEWQLVAEDAEGVNYDTAGSLFFNDSGILEESTSALLIRLSNDGGTDIELALTDEEGNPLFTALDQEFALEQQSYNGNEIGEIRSIEFDEDGNSTILYSNGDEEQGPQLAVVSLQGTIIEDVRLDLASLTGVASGQNNISVSDSDGRPLGQVVSRGFNQFGELEFRYSNGETATSDAIALANFTDKSKLSSAGDTLFQSEDDRLRRLGTAKQGFAELSAGSLELSNVELSREFADIIIVQRGYQASSQVLNVTNELIEELYNSIKGR